MDFLQKQEKERINDLACRMFSKMKHAMKWILIQTNLNICWNLRQSKVALSTIHFAGLMIINPGWYLLLLLFICTCVIYYCWYLLLLLLLIEICINIQKSSIQYITWKISDLYPDDSSSCKMNTTSGHNNGTSSRIIC